MVFTLATGLLLYSQKEILFSAIVRLAEALVFNVS